MKTKPFAVVVLAAGKGKRMGISGQKACIPIHGKPMVAHVLSSALTLAPAKTIVVVGHDAQSVRSTIQEHITQEIIFVHQKEQLGTGHALLHALPPLAGFKGDILVLYGDTPLIGSATLKNLLNKHQHKKATATVLTALMHNPTGYGRIKRNVGGYVVDIIEEKDASEEEKKVREINSGIYCFNADKLWGSLSHITNNNAQNEYYLTDVIPILSESGEKIHSVECRDAREIVGINTREQLIDVEKIKENRKNNEGTQKQFFDILIPS